MIWKLSLWRLGQIMDHSMISTILWPLNVNGGNEIMVTGEVRFFILFIPDV